MEKKREVLWYKNYFKEFYVSLSGGVRTKIKYVLKVLHIPYFLLSG